MSQKVNPFHLRSQRTAKQGTPNAGLSLKEVPHWSEICYSEPKKRKWGSNYYSRTLHENQLISDYCQGFFRTFGCYQKLCTVERSQRSTYQTIHVTSHVLRTPVSRIYDDAFAIGIHDSPRLASTVPKVPTASRGGALSYRSPKEKLLQQGLQEQWLPWILLQQVGSFLSIPSNEFPGSAQRGYPIFEDILPKVDKNVQDTYDRVPPLGAPHGSKNILEGTPSGGTREPFDLLTLINSKTGDWNDQIHEHTEFSRLKTFFSRWNQWIRESSTSLPIVQDVNAEGTSWWKPRTWTARWERTVSVDPTTTTVSTSSGNKYQGLETLNYSLRMGSSQRGQSWWGTPSRGNQRRHVQLIFTIKPVSSLVISPQLVADYIADRIEQSLPLQSVYQDIHQYFSTYESNRSTPSSTTVGAGVRGSEGTTIPKILGYRLSCSGRLQKTKFSKPAEIAESLVFQEGVLPLNSINKNIEYGSTSATNAYGSCGIKVWIHYEV